MAISQLLKSIVPDEQLTLTPEGAMKEIENFSFKGPGWYITELGSMLVVATDAVNTYIFSIFYGRDPRLAYLAIGSADAQVSTAISASIKVERFKISNPQAQRSPIYWLGVVALWVAIFVVGHKWGIRAEIPAILLLVAWVAGAKRWLNNKPKEKKHDA
jgi:hypothetical protein